MTDGGTKRKVPQTKWTPGPWSNDRIGEIAVSLGDDNIALVCFEGELNDEKECEANAHLIAAAPELYEALKEVVALSDRKQHAWDNARAALAKARGER